MKIVRVPVMHEGTFHSLVKAALGASEGVQYRGRCYEHIAGGRTEAIYRRAPHGLAWIQDRVEDYEFALFQRMLMGHCGDDGAIRHRTRVTRGANGAYRPAAGPALR